MLTEFQFCILGILTVSGIAIARHLSGILNAIRDLTRAVGDLHRLVEIQESTLHQIGVFGRSLGDHSDHIIERIAADGIGEKISAISEKMSDVDHALTLIRLSLRAEGRVYPDRNSFPDLNQRMSEVERLLPWERQKTLWNQNQETDDFWRSQLSDELFEKYKSLYTHHVPGDITVTQAINKLTKSVRVRSSVRNSARRNRHKRHSP